VNWYENQKERWAEIIKIVATEENRSVQMVEKDTIQSIFLLKLSDSELPFVFKGGTSLSKVYDLINRFSEDIDLSMSRKITESEKKSASYIVNHIAKSIGLVLTNERDIMSGYSYNKYVFEYESLFSNIQPEIERLLRDRVKELVTLPTKNNPKFIEEFTSAFPVDEVAVRKVGREKKDRPRLQKALKLAHQAYREKDEEIGTEELRGVEREVYMAVLDTLWMQHLENMQHLREGIHWRSVGQRDPLVEYRAESQKLFTSLQENLRNEVLNTIFHIHKSDAVIRQSQDDEYDTELTRLAESAVERGVNEVGAGEENRDGDFSVKKGKSNAESNRAKNQARKKKKAQRQNRKKNRK